MTKKIDVDTLSPLKKFSMLFAYISSDIILEDINNNTNKRGGGPVGEFDLSLPDINGDLHEFYAESFYNKHYILTLIVYKGKIKQF